MIPLLTNVEQSLAKPFFAAATGGNCNQLDQCDLVAKYINPTINLLGATVGLVAIISIILAGISYSMAEGDAQKVANAKNRITKTIIGLIAFAFLYVFLQFLVPGGLFG